jgi:hypothetical protein
MPVGVVAAAVTGCSGVVRQAGSVIEALYPGGIV